MIIKEMMTQATLTVTETLWGNDFVRYWLSVDGGDNWEEVQNGTQHTFTNVGNDLRTKVLFVGNGANETYIDDLQIVVVR